MAVTEQIVAKKGTGAVFRLYAGDQVQLVDVDGMQQVDLMVFGADDARDRISHQVTQARLRDGFPGPGEAFVNSASEPLLEVVAVGTDGHEFGQTTFLRHFLDPGALNLGSAEELRRVLHDEGIDFQPDWCPLNLFAFASRSPSKPGASVTFEAKKDLVCVALVPAPAMDPVASNPASDVRVAIARRDGTPEPETPTLPLPLGKVRTEIHIQKASAVAYEVEAGEYIQVIDVEGKQCSDFLAFNRSDLTEELDDTVTRSMNGRAYPKPGLYGKFFSRKFRPLIEVIQDTCGRHDTFQLACYPKYYEDMGYPGHVSCTENFNRALAPYSIGPRLGWRALNFFFNTALQEDNAIFADESWSRPGDYVLLHAKTDLLCASSACPDDIDPVNGWNPTDVHLRIYTEDNHFEKAIARRVTPDSEPVMTKKTAFHERTSTLTKDMVEYNGYWLPREYYGYGAITEHWALREKAVLIDLSPLRKFEVIGPDALALLQRCVTRDLSKRSVGQVTYSALCNPHGGLIDDCTITRLAPMNFRFVGASDYDGIWLKEQASGMRVWIKNSTDELCNLALQGPRSREILRTIIEVKPPHDFEQLRWYHCLIGRVGGVPTVITRTGYTGELGYEIWCHPSRALDLWDTVMATGRAFGLIPMGLAALDIARIEAGLIFAGCEYDDQVTPLQAGIGFTVDFDKGEFIGKEALLRTKANPHRVAVGLELAGNEPAPRRACVHRGRFTVGHVTSATLSPVLKKNIALAQVAPEYADPGTELEVGFLDSYQKRVKSRVVKLPFYDPEKKRVRS